MLSDVRRQAAAVFEVRQGPNRVPIALKAAITIALPMSISLLAGHPSLGLLCGPGAFTVLYGPNTPARFRLKLMSAAGAGFVTAGVLGTATAGSPVASVLAMVAVAVVSAVVCAALKVGPPGAYFFALVVGVAGSMAAHGVAPALVVGGIAVGAGTAMIVGMSDLLLDPFRPERTAIAAADAAITGFETSADDAKRARASAALQAAWSALNDGAGRRLSPTRQNLAAQVVGLHQRYVTRVGEVAGAAVDLSPSADPDRVVPSTIDLRQLRETALGRPRAGYLLAEALTWPSETLLVAVRVAVAGAVSGSIALALGLGHSYWAIAFSTLVLVNIGTRHAALLKAFQRFVGTVIGLGLFAGMVAASPSGWWLVLALATLQFCVELLIVRNYAYAAALITPLALTMATAGAAHPDPWSFVADRSVDTVVGVGIGILAALLIGRTAPRRLVVRSGLTTLRAISQVVSDLAAGTWSSVAGRENRRHLSFELLESSSTTDRARTDDPSGVEPYLPWATEISGLGYFALGACWHPVLRDDTALFETARARIEPLVDAVPNPTTASPIAGDLEFVLAALAGRVAPGETPRWSPDQPVDTR